MENQNSSIRKDIGAMWIRESKKGEKYVKINVVINGQKVDLVAFKNKFKEDDSKQPDYRIFLSEPKTEKPNEF